MSIQVEFVYIIYIIYVIIITPNVSISAATMDQYHRRLDTISVHVTTRCTRVDPIPNLNSFTHTSTTEVAPRSEATVTALKLPVGVPGGSRSIGFSTILCS